MKWVAAVIAVVFVFVIGFALGWTLHHPEPARVAATSVVLPPPPATSIAAIAPITPPPVDDTTPFPWPSTVAPSHDVVVVDATHTIVDAGYIDDLVRDPAKLTSSVRMVPEHIDGGIVGVRLFGVRPNSIVGKLGIQNGDRVVSINGLPASDPASMLEAYAKTSKAKNLEVEIVRRGSPMTLHYRVTGR